MSLPSNNNSGQNRDYKLLLTIPLSFIILQIFMLEAYGGNISEGWFSDIAYHLNSELNGWMAKDIPYGQSWSSGIGNLFFFIHHIFYRIFGAGLFQARMVTIICGIILLFFVFLWSNKYLSREIAIFSTFILSTSPLFILSLSDVRYELMLSLFSFLSFYLISSAIFDNENKYFLFAGIISALSIDINYRGIEIVMAVYIFHIIYFEKKSFLKRSILLLAGSFIAFVYWFLANVLPIGVDNFIKYTFIPASQDGGAYTIDILFSEINRFAQVFSDKRIYFSAIILLCYTCLLFIFFTNRRKYNKPSKALFSWFLIMFVILSLMERTTYGTYLLMYFPVISIFCGIGLYELSKYKRIYAYGAVILIVFFASAFQGGRFIKYSYHAYFKRDFDLDGFYKKLRSSVDASKSIIGPISYWYAFPDAQYYGGQFYLTRVIQVLKEFKPANEYSTDTERTNAILKVFERRKIEYVIADEYFKPALTEYFPDNKFPSKNFVLVNTITDMFLGKGNGQKKPPYKTEIYKVVSYEP